MFVVAPSCLLMICLSLQSILTEIAALLAAVPIAVVVLCPLPPIAVLCPLPSSSFAHCRSFANGPPPLPFFAMPFFAMPRHQNRRMDTSAQFNAVLPIAVLCPLPIAVLCRFRHLPIAALLPIAVVVANCHCCPCCCCMVPCCCCPCHGSSLLPPLPWFLAIFAVAFVPCCCCPCHVCCCPFCCCGCHGSLPLLWFLVVAAFAMFPCLCHGRHCSCCHMWQCCCCQRAFSWIHWRPPWGPSRQTKIVKDWYIVYTSPGGGGHNFFLARCCCFLASNSD
jgi:hypothetical protein